MKAIPALSVTGEATPHVSNLFEITCPETGARYYTTNGVGRSKLPHGLPCDTPIGMEALIEAVSDDADSSSNNSTRSSSSSGASA